MTNEPEHLHPHREQPDARRASSARPHAPNARARGPHFVPLQAVADRWRVHRTTARRILCRAGIQAYVLGAGPGGTIRYDLRDVVAYERRARGDS